MFGFGKRNKPAQPEQPTNSTGQGGAGTPAGQGGAGAPGGQGGGGAAPERKLFPWTGDPSDIACNLACGSLQGSLPGWVTGDKGIQAETYVAASGGIAGYFAQLTLKSEKPDVQLHVVTTQSGHQYYLGDPLNEMLLAKTERDAESRVWSRAGSAAVHAGMPVARVPDLNGMFRHVVGALGGPQEGLPSTAPEHQPHLPVRALLRVLVPRVSKIFTGDISDIHSRFGPVPPKWWGAITAYATARPIIDVKDVLDPTIALTILMESAIYGSKLVRL